MYVVLYDSECKAVPPKHAKDPAAGQRHGRHGVLQCHSSYFPNIFPTISGHVLTPVFSTLKNRSLVLPLQVTRDSQSVSIQAAMFLKLHATTHARNLHRVLPFCRTRKNQLQRYMGTTKMPLPSVGSNELSFWVAPTHSPSSEPPTRNTWSNGLSNAPVAQLSYCRFFQFLILWMTYLSRFGVMLREVCEM